MSIKLLIVDDQVLIREAFSLMLSVESDFELVGQCGTGHEALAACLASPVDVVLMDVEMPELDGIAATRLIREQTSSSVIILTTFDRNDYLFEALEAGAVGFLLKNCDPEQLVAGIRQVAAGSGLLAPEVTRRVIRQAVQGRRRPEPDPRAVKLTERELEVLRRMAHGESNAEIASFLVVSEATVKTHVSACLNKLGVRDRVQAVIFAFEHGLAD